jgi:dATP pyrophosphohydrolase
MPGTEIKHSIECWLHDRKTDRFLLLQCPETARHSSYWQPVTGGIERGESPFDACIREIREETGVALLKEQLILVLDAFRVFTSEKELHKTIFISETEDLHITISDEHTAFRWADPADVPSLLLWGSNRATFQRVMDYLDADT